MDFPIFLNKLIIGNKYLRHTSFWYWFRLTNHSNWRMDDHQRYWDFWYSINKGYVDTEYKWEFEKFWGKRAQPEQIVLHREDYDAIVEMLNEPPNAAIMEKLKELMNRKSPWDE